MLHYSYNYIAIDCGFKLHMYICWLCCGLYGSFDWIAFVALCNMMSSSHVCSGAWSVTALQIFWKIYKANYYNNNNHLANYCMHDLCTFNCFLHFWSMINMGGQEFNDITISIGYTWTCTTTGKTYSYQYQLHYI